MHILVTKEESAENLFHGRRHNWSKHVGRYWKCAPPEECGHISQYAKSCGGQCVCLVEAHSTMARRNVAQGEVPAQTKKI